MFPVLMFGILLGDYLSDVNALTRIRLWYEERELKRTEFDPGAAKWHDLRTNLHELEYLRVGLRYAGADGGGIDEIDGSVVFVSAHGEIGYFTPSGSLVYLPNRVPMNLEAIDSSAISKDPRFGRNYVRVTDILARERAAGLTDLYVGHHYFGAECTQWWVSRITVHSANGALSIPADARWERVFAARPCVRYAPAPARAFSGHVSGGRIVEFDSDTLLLSTGDYEFDDPKVSNDPDLSLGKILKLTISTGEVETYASGVRNPQGLLVDRRGRIWETEHGPQGGDELNLIEKGSHYGWPSVTLGVSYGYGPWPLNPVSGRHGCYTMPRYAWTPSIGVSNVIEPDPREFPLWAGDLLVLSLKMQTLYYLRVDGDRVVYSEPIHFPGDELRDAVVLEDGRIALFTDWPDLLIVRNKELGTGGDSILKAALASGVSRTPEQPQLAGEDVFKYRCAVCHSAANVRQIGPQLSGILGRRIGSADNFSYSPALQGQYDTWSKERLQSFLRDPQAMFPGTLMAPPGLSQGELEALTDYLGGLTRRRLLN